MGDKVVGRWLFTLQKVSSVVICFKGLKNFKRLELLTQDLPHLVCVFEQLYMAIIWHQSSIELISYPAKSLDDILIEAFSGLPNFELAWK